MEKAIRRLRKIKRELTRMKKIQKKILKKDAGSPQISRHRLFLQLIRELVEVSAVLVLAEANTKERLLELFSKTIVSVLQEKGEIKTSLEVANILEEAMGNVA